MDWRTFFVQTFFTRHDVRRVTKTVNGGSQGLAERKSAFIVAYPAFK